MFGKAMEMYTKHKERNGFIQNMIVKPEVLSHFHIEAYGDNIECNRYLNTRKTI